MKEKAMEFYKRNRKHVLIGGAIGCGALMFYVLGVEKGNAVGMTKVATMYSWFATQAALHPEKTLVEIIDMATKA